MTYGHDSDGYRTDRLYAGGRNLFLSCSSVLASVDSDIVPVCAWVEQAYGEHYLDSIHWHVRRQDIEYSTKLEFTPWVSLRRSISYIKIYGHGAGQPDGGQYDEWWLSPSVPEEKYECFSEVQQRPAVDEAGNYND
jgi:hypothetical protein